MLKLLLIYNLLVVGLIEIISVKNIRSFSGTILPVLLLPLTYHLSTELIRQFTRRRHSQATVTLFKTVSPKTTAKGLEGQVLSGPAGISDRDRRLFLKLIGSTGLSLLFMALIGKKSAQAAFFGSLPGPGTVALKNSSGIPIDPAEKQPTDGYKISQLDDSGSPYIYFGFVNKDGAWYIQRETISGLNSGDYRYYKGISDFSTNWSGRAVLAYDDFNNIF